MSRFKLALTALALLAVAAATLYASGQIAHAAPMTLYIGTYSKDSAGGICTARFDPDTGQLSDARVVAVASNASWVTLAPDGKALYAFNNDQASGVRALRVAGGGALEPLNLQPMGGALTHIGADATGKWLLVAAYGAGNFALFPIAEDGSIGPRKQLIPLENSGPHPRQKASHAHQALFSPDNRRAWVADLGGDKVMLYDFDAQKGTLAPSDPPFIETAPGAGPRHLTFSHNRAYVVNELDNTITVFDDADKTPKSIQNVSSLPPNFVGKTTAAEVEASADDRFLYVSNRGANGTPSSIATYAIAPDGKLSAVAWSETGSQPRHFALDPSGKWLLAANMQERAITVYEVDAATGTLSFHSKLLDFPGEPTCLVWARDAS